jgi:serine/threonine protein kinase/WD40 repeat protein
MRLGAAAAQTQIEFARGPEGRPAFSPSKEERQAPTGSANRAALPRLGDYELLEVIAHGGMGVVYRARQVSLNRMVAVKVLVGGEFAQSRFIERFRREAEAAASLSHPNIVAVHEVGAHEGQPYFSMELIEGRTLAELARDKPLPARESARLLRTIAEAVQFAHRRGVLHRDLKPSNVLVDAQGAPHITDFGLAKRLVGTRSTASQDILSEARDEVELAPTAELTLAGQVLGSPNYMPPEQADPKRGPTTATSDLYSLGAILYHLLTGRAPFMAETLTQTLRLVIECEAVMPRLLNPNVPRDLETICIKCLEKEPARRYASAQELADELNRFLNDEPIRARPILPIAKLARWCRRKPTLAASSIIAIILLLVIAVGSPIAAIRIDRERKAAETARLRAEHAERETQKQLYTALLGQAHVGVQSRELGQRVGALDAIRRAAAISNSAELRREALAALAQPDLRFERELPTGRDVTFVSLDPSFERVAIGRGITAVEIRSARDNQRLATLPSGSTNRPAHVARWSADGQFLAVKRDYDASGERADLEIWNITNGHHTLLRDVSWGCVSFHPEHRRVLVGTANVSARIVDLGEERELNRFSLAAKPVHLKFSPDGTRFAAVCWSAARAYEAVSVHDSGTGETLWANRWTNTSTRQIAAINWHPAGQWLAVPDSSGAVTLIDAATGQMRLLGEHKAQAVAAEFTPDGRYLFTGGWEREFICWDMHTMQRAFTIGAGDEIQIRADGRQCAIRTKTALQLHAFEMPLQREFPEAVGTHLRQATFSPDGRWLAASGEKGGAVWDLVKHGPGVFLEEASGESFYFTPDGRELFASSSFRWHIAPATNRAAPRVERLPFRKFDDSTSLCLSSNSFVLTSPKGSQVLGPQEIESGTNRWIPTIDGIKSVSPDGHWLGIFRAFGSSLYIYRLPALERVAKLTHPAAIGFVQFSPRTDEVAICSSRAGVEFWSTTTWKRTRALTNFTRIMIAPDGRGWWLTKDVRNAGLYEPETLRELLPLPPGTLPLAISMDGGSVAASVDARRLQLWDLNKVRDQLRALGLDWPAQP